MAFHDAYEHPEKKAIHGKLIQSDTVSEHNLSVTTNHSLLATTYQIYGQLACNPAFYSGHQVRCGTST